MQAQRSGTLEHFLAGREPFIFPQIVSAALLYDNFQLFTWLAQRAFVAEQQGSFIDKSLHWFQHAIFLCSCNARRNVWHIFLISTGFHCVYYHPLWIFSFSFGSSGWCQGKSVLKSYYVSEWAHGKICRPTLGCFDVIFKKRLIQLTYSHSRSRGVLVNCLRH